MEFMITYYTVTIAAPASQTAPQDGFVDPVKVEVYLQQNYPSDFNYGLSQAKRRANLRYLSVIQQLGLMANCYTVSYLTPGGSADSAPSSFVMTIQIERGDEVLVTPDELVPGAVLTGAAAIRRCVARGLMLASQHNADVYDPTLAVTTGNPTLASRYQTRILPLVVAPYSANLAMAEATVTVAPASLTGT